MIDLDQSAREQMAALRKQKRDATKAMKALTAVHDVARKKAAMRARKERDKAIGKRSDGKTPRQHDKVYLAWIRRQPCCVCARPAPSEAAHVRSGYPEAGWRPTGMGEKPSDARTLPLCPTCHRIGPKAQHAGNERAWWQFHGLHPPTLCAELAQKFERGENER